jgi:hypothetical protein
MNKRTALLVASGLVFALVAAGFGIVMGFTGPSDAKGRVHLKAKKPVVKTVTDHKTVHVPASGARAGATTTVLTKTPAPPVDDDSTTTQGGDHHQDSTTDADPTETESQRPEPSETHSESQSPEPQDDD